MESIVQKIQEQIDGRVLYKDSDVTRFCRDQSIYRLRPLGVVIPKSEEDIVHVVRCAADAGIPITPRGGGSGTAGAGLGRGIMIAFSPGETLNRILDFTDNSDTPSIHLESGVIHSHMQAYLRERGFYLPADPSSAEMCLIGGNIATKASGPHALRHGSIDRYLEHLCFVTAEGEYVDTSDPSSIPRHLLEKAENLRQRVTGDAETEALLNKRAGLKIASGYNLFPLVKTLPTEQLLAQLLVGSVGTLGIITSATLRPEPFIEGKATGVFCFTNLHEAGDAVQYIRRQDVAAIEIISAGTIRMVRQKRPRAFDMVNGDGHLLLVEYEGPERFDQIEQTRRIMSENGYRLAAPVFSAEDEQSQAALWKARKQLLPVIMNPGPPFKALSVVNDVGVAVPMLADFIVSVESIFERYGLEGAIYGHAGSGNLHLRPLFNLDNPGLENQIRQLADDVYQAVFDHQGTITAEHGMGRLRAPYLKLEWGETVVSYMKEVKDIFDPEDRLNPDVMFSSRSITDGMAVR